MSDHARHLLVDVLVRRAGLPREGLIGDLVDWLCARVLEEHVAVDLLDDPQVEVLASNHGVRRENVARLLVEQPSLVECVTSRDEPSDSGAPLCLLDERYLSFRRLARAEWAIDQCVRDSLQSPRPWPTGFREIRGGELEQPARRLFTRRLSLVVGGPGTGKTTLVARVLSALESLAEPGARLRVVLAAPTGKAAVRLMGDVLTRADEESWSAVTVDKSRSGSLHHMLGLTPRSNRARRAPDADLVIVDEASMASLALVSQLVTSLPPDTRLLLVGDPHQLASVDEGSVLADLVDAAHVTDRLTTSLTVVHRTDSRDIMSASSSVLKGDSETLRRLTERSSVVHLVDVVTPELRHRLGEHARRVGRLAHEDPGRALAATRELVVLCAHREGPGSTRWWRDVIAASHRVEFPRLPGSAFSVGEPVIVTRTQRHLNLVNGDVGIVMASSDGPFAYFGKDRHWPLEGVGYLESAWALTIHKSQGSEYADVVVSLGESAESHLLSRELVYTGLTRAKNAVTVVATPDVLEQALGRGVSRTSALAHRVSSP